MDKKEEVEHAITLIRKSIERGWLIIIDRLKNRECLAILDMSPGDQAHMLENLTYENFVSGPESDHSGEEGEIFVFGSFVDSTELYIKVNIKEKSDLVLCKLISFHQTSSALNYPLRGL